MSTYSVARMKGMLFLSFLLMFWVNFIVTIAGVLNWVMIRDVYLTPLFTALIIQSIAAMIALFKGTRFFEDEAAPQSQQKP